MAAEALIQNENTCAFSDRYFFCPPLVEKELTNYSQLLYYYCDNYLLL